MFSSASFINTQLPAGRFSPCLATYNPTHNGNLFFVRYLEQKPTIIILLYYNLVLPLHNNSVELGARRMVRKRDIALHTWSAKGTKVRDAFMPLVQTTEKLGVSALQYINDRVRQKYELSSLEELIAMAYGQAFTSTF